jgi:ABC-type glycerol-3-phosphate transport system substrate-binding protein
MKKVWSILLALVLVVSVAGCKSKPKATKLVIWAFTDELKKVVEDYKAANPGIEVTFSIIPNEEYPTKLRPVLRSGTGAPDIFLGEAAYVRRFALEGQWAKLTKEFPKMTKQYESQAPAYVTDMGRDADGDIVAMSWQATPGGFFYKRSVAKEALGTDDPGEVSAMLADNTKLLETAEKLKGKGKFLLCGFGSWFRVAAAARKTGFVDGSNNLVVDPALMEYMDFAKTLRESGYTAKVGQWSPGWFGNMAKTDVLLYVLPTWGLHYVIKKNAGDTAGDWGIAKGPASYFWGGTWMGMYKNSEAKELAKEFINMLCVDAEYQEKYTREVGDFMSNLAVDEMMAGEDGDPFLSGQNHYQYFLSEAKNITPGLITRYDLDLDGFFGNAVNSYVEGKMTKEEAIADFKANVKNSYPEINVD